MLIVLTFGISILGFVPTIAGKAIVGLVGIALIVYLARLPATPE